MPSYQEVSIQGRLPVKWYLPLLANAIALTHMLTTVSHTGVGRQEACERAGAVYYTAPFPEITARQNLIFFKTSFREETEGGDCTQWLLQENEKGKKKSRRDSYQLLLSCQGFRHVEASATSQRARPLAARSRHAARDRLLSPAHTPPSSNRWRFINWITW